MENHIAAVSLREVTVENLGAVLSLEVAESQRRFVATNAKSIAQAHFYPEAWYRAIYSGDEPAGFIMLHDESLRAEPREVGYFFLWRLMVAQSFQGQGIGRAAIDQLVAHVRTRPDAARLLTSCFTGPGSPEGFYEKLGFVPTGNRTTDGEIELSLAL